MKESPLVTCIVGGSTFTSTMRSALASQGPSTATTTCLPGEAWATVLEQHPHLLIVEIGRHHGDTNHNALRQLLTSVRQRFGHQTFVALALTAPERLFFGGDLLFAPSPSLDPSGLVNAFLVDPPSNIVTLPSLTAQAIHLVQLVRTDLVRVAKGGPPLPPLGDAAWPQSMADSASLETWMRWLPRYADYTEENPLIVGETGTGKTRCAHAIHLLSGRTGKFVSITPRDFSSSELVQAELFGAVAGAYTGAVDKWGLVKSAERGTLFIDELQSIDKDLQGKLITFIENKIYRRVGSAETVSADVRFVFATNRPLDDLMKSGTLRDDFAYRLERVQVELEPLRVRKLDIAAATAFALAKIHRQRPRASVVQGLTREAFRIVFRHPWPGNLRQLENSIARLCEVCDVNGASLVDQRMGTRLLGDTVDPSAVSSSEIFTRASLMAGAAFQQSAISSLQEGIEQFTTSLRAEALTATGGDIAASAHLIKDDEQMLRTFARARATVPPPEESEENR